MPLTLKPLPPTTHSAHRSLALPVRLSFHRPIKTNRCPTLQGARYNILLAGMPFSGRSSIVNAVRTPLCLPIAPPWCLILTLPSRKRISRACPSSEPCCLWHKQRCLLRDGTRESLFCGAAPTPARVRPSGVTCTAFTLLRDPPLPRSAPSSRPALPRWTSPPPCRRRLPPPPFALRALRVPSRHSSLDLLDLHGLLDLLDPPFPLCWWMQ